MSGASQGTATVTAPSRRDRLEAGQMLGSRYRIEAEAGEGGMGRVYRAMDLELNRTVALKIIRPELAHDEVTVARLKQEIRLASEISHPHVLRIHDLGEAKGIRFISMAWVEGEDLQHYMGHRGRLDEKEIFRIAEQVCEGLQAAHDKGIIHRDLKPQNILMNENGEACIADFGLAQTIDHEASAHLTQTGHVVGTPRYMAPEQLAGKAIDHRTDIYSLGLVLYEMATGDTPDLRQRLSQAAPSPKLANPAISDKLARILLRCLEPEAEKRYATVRELSQDLRADHTAARSKRASWNSRWVYAAAAVAVLAVVAVIALRRRTGELPPLSKGKYVAVLPFETAGSDNGLRSYAQGITDAVATRLFTLQDVHPISQAAVERADLKKPVEAIARQVGANVIADGSIGSHDGRIVVHSRVLDAGHHKVLAENTFTGDANSLLDIENGIFGQIAGALDARTTAKPSLENITAHPTGNPEAYDLYLKGRELLKEKRDVDGAMRAVDLFQQACAKDPSFALAWTGVADASLQIYRTKRESFWAAKALDAARHAASGGSDLPEVHFTLGSVYTATGKNAEAVEELKRALELEPNSDNGYLRLGRAYLATGQSEAALSALRKAVDLNPYYWYNHDQLGLAYYRMGRNTRALAEFKNAADLDPSNGKEYNRIGATYWRMGRLQDSIEQFKKVIKLEPSGDAYTNLGTTYFALGRYREAIVNFKKAAQINDNNIEYMANLADAYRQAGQKEEAAKANGDAIRLAYQQLQVNPQDSATMGYLAMCYVRKDDLEKAAEFVRQARAIDPADNQLMYDEAVVNALSGKSQQALTVLKQALENGYSVEEAKADADLKALRSIPEFQKLLRTFESQAEARR
ncbi:MAG TPA: tetratricopeptide repeat protein [Bryobacteraceae bacterium]|nr:tetratricopeptide repeat protein [Bryobacteraceae bacterium]